MTEPHILKDIDNLCRDLIDCLQSSRKFIDAKRVNNYELAQKMTGMVVQIGTLLSELRQSKLADDAGEETRLDTIGELIACCKDLEGELKEQRNDLKK